jgi:hypothetical protein
MKSFTLVLVALALSTASLFGQTESEIRDQIVGTWKLVSTEQTMKNGTTRPHPEYGAHGKGFLMYQRDGYMCADLVNPDRPRWASDSHPTSEACEGTRIRSAERRSNGSLLLASLV